MSRSPRRKKRFLILLVLVVLIIPAGWFIENGRGASAFDEMHARASEAGVSLVRADYAGPDISDDENLLKDPVFADEVFRKREPGLDAWRNLPVVERIGTSAFMNPASGETLKYAGFFEGGMSEDEARLKLGEAARDYELRLDELRKAIWRKPAHPLFTRGVATEDLQGSRSLTTGLSPMIDCFRSSGLMALRSENPRRALETIKTMDRITETTGDPYFIGYLLFANRGSLDLQLIWEGVRLRLWTEDEMADLSRLIAKRNYKKPLLMSLKYQAAVEVEAYDSTTLLDEPLDVNPLFRDRVRNWVRNRGPAGWTHQRKALMVKSYLKAIKAVENDDRDALEELSEELPKCEWSPLGAVSERIGLATRMMSASFWKAETRKRIALIALSAERYYFSQKKYPKSLLQMKLDFPVVDLTDPQKRELGYQLGPDGRPEIGSLYEEEMEKSQSNRSLRWQFWSK